MTKSQLNKLTKAKLIEEVLADKEISRINLNSLEVLKTEKNNLLTQLSDITSELNDVLVQITMFKIEHNLDKLKWYDWLRMIVSKTFRKEVKELLDAISLKLGTKLDDIINSIKDKLDLPQEELTIETE